MTNAYTLEHSIRDERWAADPLMIAVACAREWTLFTPEWRNYGHLEITWERQSGDAGYYCSIRDLMRQDVTVYPGKSAPR